MVQNSDLFDSVRREFGRLHGGDDNMVIVRSPGRINLIGEHTDYNEGFVLPSAVDRAIYLAVAPSAGFGVTITSLDFKDSLHFDSQRPTRSDKSWANYLIGMVNELRKAGYNINGFNCVYAGDIPIGAGMSSSAAVEAGLGFALNAIFDLGIDRAELARIAQRSENEFVGVRCGIMDQFANLLSMGKSALHLDCRSLKYEHIPFISKDLEFLLCDTGVKHSLASSEYNLRREQCESGVKVIKKYVPEVRSLRDVHLDMLQEHEDELGATVLKRCRYVVEENVRVNSASTFLNDNDYVRFGGLLYLSHQGLKEQFEVTCMELDFLVDEASKLDGVLGARMMGGGFGGCTLNLIERDSLDEFKRRIQPIYLKKTGKLPKMYECNLVPGTDVITD